MSIKNNGKAINIRNNNEAIKLLYRLFLWEKTYYCYDMVGAIYKYINLHNGEDINFYWSSNWFKAVPILGLLDDNLIEIARRVYRLIDSSDQKESLDLFRNLVLKEYIEWVNVKITIDDIWEFMKQLAQNRIWDDNTIKTHQGMVYQISNISNHIKIVSDDINDWDDKITNWDDKITNLNISDFNLPDLSHTIDISNIEVYSPEFEAQEKANWKNYIQPEFHPFVDRINLTLLKQLMKDPMNRPFIPTWWQKDFLLHHRRFNTLVASRRSGKSYNAWYLIGRQLLLPMQNIVIIVPTLKNHAKPIWRYLKWFFKQWGWTGWFKFDKANYTITNEATQSECSFYTAERDDSVRGNAANLLIIDEAAFVNESLYNTARPLISTTKWMTYIISTIDPKTPINRFYYEIIDSELDMYDPKWVKRCKRIDLDSNPFIDDDEKNLIRKDSHKNVASYNAERMCLFQNNEMFNLSKFWKIILDTLEIEIWGIKLVLPNDFKEYDEYVIWYDWWQNMDKSWLVVIWIKDNKWKVICSTYLSWMKYNEQIEVVSRVYKLFSTWTWTTGTLGRLKQVELVIDYSWVGIAIEQMFSSRWIYTTNVQFVGWNFEGREWNIIRVGKDLLLSKLQVSIEIGYLQWYNFMNDLRFEFETFSDALIRKSTVTHHNDIISALMIANYICDKYGKYNEPFLEINQRVNTFLTDAMWQSYETMWQRLESWFWINNSWLSWLFGNKNNNDYTRYWKFWY